MVLLCLIFLLGFITLTYGVLGQVWYLIVMITDLCLLTYFFDPLYRPGTLKVPGKNHYIKVVGL